jgi:hypothetical protein
LNTVHETNKIGQKETPPKKRWVSRDGHVQWSQRSPNLASLDFHLWGWMKSKAYKQKVNTRDKLVAHVMNSAALLKQERQDNLSRAVHTIVKRVEKYIGVSGGIFELLQFIEIIYITNKCNQ